MPQLTVSFADQSSRSGPLSFGHANILRSIVVDDDPTRLNLAMVFDAPADGLDRIIDQVRYLVERHESLRTVYRLDPVVSQQVLGHAELQLPVIEAPDDALNRAEEVARRLRATVFDLESELPFRAAVVTTGGVPRHLVWVVSHAAMDVAACELLHVEWTRMRELSVLLERFPDVAVIWAHGGYTPLFIARRMLERHPNLTYELSARTWARHPRSPDYTMLRDGTSVWPEWLALIEAQPERFVVGTDASQRSAESEEMKFASVQSFLRQLSPPTREKVARGNLLNLLGPLR